jgi:hypothetical protein
MLMMRQQRTEAVVLSRKLCVRIESRLKVNTAESST